MISYNGQLRVDDREYWIYQKPAGSDAFHTRAQRSRLQSYNSDELKEVPEFHYEKLPQSKKRIRLLQLSSGTTDGPEIYCELIEADYDNEFHIPTRVSARQKEEEEAWAAMSEEDRKKKHEPEAQAQKKPGAGTPQSEQAKSQDDKTQDGGSQDAGEHAGEREEKGGRAGSQDTDDQEMRQRYKEVIRNEIKYEALSWCWGTDAPDYAVLIKYKNKTYKKRVRRELGLALKFLRKPAEARTLWADAICINQDDDEERNNQVQMMSRIYTRAKEVCIWLGEDSDESKTAIDFIHKEIMELRNFEIICSDKRYSQKWSALLTLMQREWFSRRWVVQEIALASSATLYCGPDSISWKEFAVAVELFVEVETATHRLSEIMQKDEKFQHVPGWFEHVSELGASLLVQATGKVFRAQRTPMQRKSDESDDEWEQLREESILREKSIDPLDRRSLLSLEYLVSTLFIFKASEPRDTVYSLLAISRDAAPFAKSSSPEKDKSFLVLSVMDSFLEKKPFTVDYARAYPDVCRDFVDFVVRRKNVLDPAQALDILCRPWALEAPTGKSNRLPKKTDDPASRKRLMPERLKEQHAKEDAERFEVARPQKTDADKARVEDEKNLHPVHWKREYVDKPPTKRKREWVGETTEELKNYWKRVDNLETKLDFKDSGHGYDHDWRAHPKGWDLVRDFYFPARDNSKPSPSSPPSTAKGKKRRAKRDLPATPTLDLPGWVARSMYAPFSLYPHPGMHIKKTGRSNADPLVGQPQDGHRNYSAAQTNPVDLDTLKFRKRLKSNHYSLYVRGFELDIVETVLDASQGGNIPKSWLDLGDWDDSEDHSDDPPDHFWRTLVADRGRDNRNPPYYYATACKESVQKGGIMSGRVNTSDLINNERNSIVAEFCRRVQAVIWERRLFKTENGALGLARDVQKGDKVCILYGCTVPVILRKVAKGKDANEIEEVLNREKFDDCVEALKSCLQKLEKIMERRAKYEQLKKERGPEYEKEIRDALRRAKTSKTWAMWAKAEAAKKVKGSQRYDKDRLDEDEKSYYEFKGETYVHGMMDGEALRRKFYLDKPDTVFELR